MYFGGEGGLMGFTWKLPTKGKIPITLGDLYNAAMAGSMPETDLFKQIIQFVKDKRGNGVYYRHTELYRHLKLRGNDAYEFIVAFGKRFNVNISTFEFQKYFHPPKKRFLFAILDLFKGRSPIKQKLTLGDLEKAVINGEIV